MPDSPAFDAADEDSLRAEPAASAPADRSLELESLYRSHYAKVAGYFQRCGLPEAAARDLAQDVFVSALRALPAFRGESKLSTWMWTIARNALLAHLRSNKPLDTQLDEPDLLDSLIDPRVDPLKDEHVCVRRGFARFAREHPERAQTIYLAIVEGWTREELAEHLGRTPHAATEYLSQCKARLRPYIEHCRGD